MVFTGMSTLDHPSAGARQKTAALRGSLQLECVRPLRLAGATLRNPAETVGEFQAILVATGRVRGGGHGLPDICE